MMFRPLEERQKRKYISELKCEHTETTHIHTQTHTDTHTHTHTNTAQHNKRTHTHTQTHTDTHRHTHTHMANTCTTTAGREGKSLTASAATAPSQTERSGEKHKAD